MKSKYLFLLLLSIFLVFTCIPIKEVRSASSFEVSCNQRNDTVFKIVKIDSVGSVYLVYAEFNDTIYKIASPKVFSPDCHRVKLGEYYNLDIASVFDENSYDALDKYGVFINNTLIKLQKDSTVIWDLFETGSLRGLCYTP